MFNRILILLCLVFFHSLNLWAAPQVLVESKENFIALADLHFDPFIACKNESPCPLINLLRKAPVNQWSAILAKYDRDLPGYRQDSNFSLLTSALTAAKKVAEEQNAKFVVILGDFLGHDLNKSYRKYTKDRSSEGSLMFINKTMAFLSLEIKKNFPNLDVYPVIGNNDARDDYLHESYSPFLSATADSWSTLIKHNANRQALLSTFKAHGYYAATIPNAHLKLLMVNSVLFSNNARGKTREGAAAEELKWLRHQLQQAQDQNYHVMILMHIPPGVDVYATLRFKLFTLIELWRPKYTKAFSELLETYHGQVSGILAGHLHADWFQILTFAGKDEIPSMGVPAISPIFGNNPGFKSYQYDSYTGQLENYTTYYYPMASARIWQKEYDFKRIYSENCNACSIVTAMKSLAKGNKLEHNYKNFYSVSTTSQPITKYFLPYWCSIHHNWKATLYRSCLIKDIYANSAKFFFIREKSFVTKTNATFHNHFS